MQTLKTSRSSGFLLACAFGVASAACGGGSGTPDTGNNGGDGGMQADTGQNIPDVTYADGAHPDVSPISGTWTTVQSMVPDGSRIASLWGSSATDIYATAGQYILHYTGSSWTHTQTDYVMYAVWGTGPTDVWASGATIPPSGSAETGHDVFRHNNGGAWTDTMLTSSVHYTGLFLRAPDDGWAVGLGGAAHFDGTAWTPFASNFGTTEVLNSVWAPAPMDAVIVGQHTYRLSAGAWMPQQAGQGEYYTHVWGFSADDIWLVGTSSYIQHWDGTGWHDVDPGHDLSANLNAAWGTAPNDWWAVGDGGVIIHYNGVNFDLVPSGTTENLSSVWGSGPNDIWAGGDDGTLLHYHM